MKIIRPGIFIFTTALIRLASGALTDCPPNTPVVPNSYYDPPGPWPDDQRVDYKCDPGYKIVAGDGRMVCHINKGDYHWHKLGTGPIPPECRRYYRECPWTLPNITNGYLDPTTAPDGGQVEYKCDYHYAIEGTAKAKCDISGDEYSFQWDSVPTLSTHFPPECIYSYWDCPSPGAIVGGYIYPAAPWANNDVMQYKCDPGLVLVGGDTGTCHIAAGSFSYYWTYTPASFPDWPPKCVVGYDFCLTPGDIVNGYISPTTPNPWAPTDKVKYECDSHYKMFGTGEAECFIPYDKQSYQWQTDPLGMTDFPPNCIYRYDPCRLPNYCSENDMVADPEDCRQYLQCIKGEWKIKKCKANKCFHFERDVCDTCSTSKDECHQPCPTTPIYTGTTTLPHDPVRNSSHTCPEIGTSYVSYTGMPRGYKQVCSGNTEQQRNGKPKSVEDLEHCQLVDAPAGYFVSPNPHIPHTWNCKYLIDFAAYDSFLVKVKICAGVCMSYSGGGDAGGRSCHATKVSNDTVVLPFKLSWAITRDCPRFRHVPVTSAAQCGCS